jgi:hypothetical protein
MVLSTNVRHQAQGYGGILRLGEMAAEQVIPLAPRGTAEMTRITQSSERYIIKTPYNQHCHTLYMSGGVASGAGNGRMEL